MCRTEFGSKVFTIPRKIIHLKVYVSLQPITPKLSDLNNSNTNDKFVCISNQKLNLKNITVFETPISFLSTLSFLPRNRMDSPLLSTVNMTYVLVSYCSTTIPRGITQLSPAGH